MTKTPHDYAQLLRWVADGETIEQRRPGGQWEVHSDIRIMTAIVGGHAGPFAWYRIQPEKVEAPPCRCSSGDWSSSGPSYGAGMAAGISLGLLL